MIKTKYESIPNQYFSNYLEFLVGRVWKILPMREENNQNLQEYMEGLQRELVGNMHLIDDLKYDGYFITLLNKIEFLINEEYTHEVCRKEVFESINIIEKISTKYDLSGDNNG